MSDSDHYSGLPIPTYGESPSGPGAFSDFRAAIAPHIVLFATTEADRNNRYTSVPAGTVVSSTTMKAMWLRTATGWETIYYDSGWQSLNNVAWQADWSGGTGDSKYRIFNDTAFIYFDATYSGADITATSNGRLDSKVLDLPSTARPSNVDSVMGRYRISGRPAYGDIVAYGTGGVYLRSLSQGVTLSAGDAISGSIMWMLP